MPKTPAVIKKVLPNGLRVILAPQPGNVAGTVLVLVEAGSEYEARATNGLSHFLEHMVFKGTANRPTSQQISSELDALGAEYNAFTGQEHTGYWAKVRTEKVPQILDIVSDLYLNPVFDGKEIEKERGVIIEEINMYEDTPARKVHELFSALLYGDQPAGWDVLGTKENILKLQRNDFVRYRGERYTPDGTVLVVAGNFKLASVLATIKKLFGRLPNRKAPTKAKTAATQKEPAALVRFKESDQAHLVIGVRAFDMFDKRRYALQVLANVAGGGMSSRLFHRIREEMGAAYYVRAGADLLADHGYFTVSAGSDTKRAEEIIRATLEELARLAQEPVPTAEFRKAKDHLSGGLMLNLETSDELAGFYGSQEVAYRKLTPPTELVRRIGKVTAKEVQAVARDLFRDAALNLAVIGPYKDENAFRSILRFP